MTSFPGSTASMSEIVTIRGRRQGKRPRTVSRGAGVGGDADIVDAADDPAAGVRDDVSPRGGEHVGVVGANGHAESVANA